MFFSKTENEGLWNFLEGKKAMEEQSHDLLNFRKTGQQCFENFVMRSYIKVPALNLLLEERGFVHSQSSQHKNVESNK